MFHSTWTGIGFCQHYKENMEQNVGIPGCAAETSFNLRTNVTSLGRSSPWPSQPKQPFPHCLITSSLIIALINPSTCQQVYLPGRNCSSWLLWNAHGKELEVFQGPWEALIKLKKVSLWVWLWQKWLGLLLLCWASPTFTSTVFWHSQSLSYSYIWRSFAVSVTHVAKSEWISKQHIQMPAWLTCIAPLHSLSERCEWSRSWYYFSSRAENVYECKFYQWEVTFFTWQSGRNYVNYAITSRFKLKEMKDKITWTVSIVEGCGITVSTFVPTLLPPKLLHDHKAQFIPPPCHAIHIKWMTVTVGRM